MTPRPLSAGRADIAAAIAQAPALAILSDFDGTLARIQRDPERVQLPSNTRDALERLAQRALVGVISGRGLADIRERVGLRGICYSGCHGYLLQDTRGHVLTLATQLERARMARAMRTLLPRLRQTRGIRLEKKEVGVAVHYRGATQASIRHARALIDGTLATHPSLHLLPGAKVWEILPGRGVDKLTAIRLLLVLEQYIRTLVLYIGDDVTDERVFAQVRKDHQDHKTWVTVAVGKTSDTAANYFAESPAEVRRFLIELAS